MRSITPLSPSRYAQVRKDTTDRTVAYLVGLDSISEQSHPFQSLSSIVALIQSFPRVWVSLSVKIPKSNFIWLQVGALTELQLYLASYNSIHSFIRIKPHWSNSSVAHQRQGCRMLAFESRRQRDCFDIAGCRLQDCGGTLLPNTNEYLVTLIKSSSSSVNVDCSPLAAGCAPQIVVFEVESPQ